MSRGTPERIRVTITEEDIQDGEAGDGAHCPIATALRRQYPQHEPFVTYYDATLTAPGSMLDCYWLSRRARRFAVAFDQGRPVQPSAFILVLR